MPCRGDDNKEADDLTDLLTAFLEGTIIPEGGDRLEVIDKLMTVAIDVDSLTSKNLEDLTSTDIRNDVPDGLLKTSKTTGLEGIGNGIDSISKLEKSTLDGLDVELLDTVDEINNARIHVTDDLVDVTGTARRITHLRAHTLSNTADQLESVIRSDVLGGAKVVLIDEDAKDLSDVLTGSVELLLLPGGGDILEEADEVCAVGDDVHDLVLDESLNLTVLDLSDDLDDGFSHLLKTASLESISKLLDTVGKGKEALNDRLDTKVLDTVSNKLEGIIEVAGHVGDVLNTGGGIAHDDIKTNSNTLQEGDNILLGAELTVLIELLIGGNDETRLVNCTGRNDQSKNNKSKRTHCRKK